MSYFARYHTLHDVILCTMSYFPRCHTFHDVLLYMMSYFEWCHTLHDVILCTISYFAWCHTFVMSYFVRCHNGTASFMSHKRFYIWWKLKLPISLLFNSRIHQHYERFRIIRSYADDNTTMSVYVGVGGCVGVSGCVCVCVWVYFLFPI